MTGAMTRDISVQYGDYTIADIVGKPSYRKDGRTFQFSCQFLVRADTAAAADTAFDAVESALNEWDRALDVTIGSYQISHDPSDNTGLLNRGSVIKQGSPADSTTSRLYLFTCTGMLPGTETGKSGGLVQYSMHVTFDAAKIRTVRFNLEYTASGNNTAIQNWDDGTTGAKALAAAELTALGGNYDFIREERGKEDKNKHIIGGALLYRERLVPETVAGGANANYFFENISISRTVGGESSEADSTPVYYSVQFSVALDRSITTYSGMQDFWESDVKPVLLDILNDALLTTTDNPASDSRAIIENENIQFLLTTSRITGNLHVLAPSNTSLIASRRHVTISWSANEVFRKLLDGKPFTYSIYGMGESIQATEIVTNINLDGAVDTLLDTPDFAQSNFARFFTDKFEGAEWRLLNFSEDASMTIRGQFQDSQVEYHARTYTRTWKLIAPVVSAGLFSVAKGG